jgi:hypothetical protein
MAFSIFSNKKDRPSGEEINTALGAMLPAWDSLVRYIREMYPVEEDFKFMYGKKYGWARYFRIRGKLLTSLYPNKGYFVVQVNLPPAAVELALQMSFGGNVQSAIGRATPYPEGRWVFVPVGESDAIGDIHRLLALRVETKRLV